MGNTLKEAYGKYFAEMMSKSKAPANIDDTNIYQPANLDLQPYMFKILEDNFLPGSGLGGIEYFKEFYDAVQSGKSGLILMEHFTNLDLPAIIWLLKQVGEPWAEDFSKKIVAIAGMKLNEQSDGVRVWTEGFSRVVIYPTRSLEKVSDAEREEEEKKARKINFASMRAMDACKKRGEVILVFPSGTRYRPGVEETRKGLREIDSYLRLFDKMLLVSINGNCLSFNPANMDDMLADLVQQDKVLLTAHPVLDCKEFRNKVLESLPADDPDPKQKTIDAVMDILKAQHDEVEKTRLS